MKVKTQKIVAREFLILVACLAVSTLIYFGISLYNYGVTNNTNKMRIRHKEMKEKSESLLSEGSDKIQRRLSYHQALLANFENEDTAYNNSEFLFKRLSHWAKFDSLTYKWHHVWDNEVIDFHKKLNINSPDELKSFINSTDITDMDMRNGYDGAVLSNKSLDLYNDILIKEKKIFGDKAKMSASIKWLLGLILVAFAGRYLLYSIKWSVKTIKAPN